MADSTVDISSSFDSPQKLLKVVDNLDGTYSVSASVANMIAAVETGLATSANQGQTKGYNGTNRQAVGLDLITRVLTIIDYAHHEIHEGDMYSYCEVNDLANGAVRDLLIVTPNTTKWAHMFVQVESESETDYKFYEAPTTTGDGTGVVEQNRNRNVANANTTVISHTPTIAGGSEGTLLCHKHWGAGKGSGGGDRSINEWVLKQNTKYLVRITNATTGANQVATELHWYEHTNKAV